MIDNETILQKSPSIADKIDVYDLERGFVKHLENQAK